MPVHAAALVAKFTTGEQFVPTRVPVGLAIGGNVAVTISGVSIGVPNVNGGRVVTKLAVTRLVGALIVWQQTRFLGHCAGPIMGLRAYTEYATPRSAMAVA